ncbi:uncharacterized protein LOC105285755 isoform X2 [Ooceraea biroi]|uniref:uncharacterized protein LOC105285755 isoform X2 n=1 Tax=Ooceraea biroi TaxID=2015173 RepID=UPI000F092BF8|nr:uncharacterized protein LOC105285755 isoform X2 [Ooceraea biroi]
MIEFIKLHSPLFIQIALITVYRCRRNFIKMKIFSVLVRKKIISLTKLFHLSREMIFAGERCFKLHRLMFLAMGLWPYQKSSIWKIQSAFFFSVYCSNLFSQLLPFVTMVCNMDCSLKRFSYVCILIACFVSYYSFYFNSEIVMRALQHMQHDWKMFESSDAINIFEEYLFEAYSFVFSALIFLVVAAIIFVIFECSPIILDVIAPMNKSRLRKVEVDFELFVDQEQYFVLYLVHEILGATISIWSIITTATFLITVFKHSCATYKIASYLIRNTITDYTLQLPVAQKLQFMHQNICLSVYIHRRTFEFCKDFLLSLDLWYFSLLLICVLSLSCLLLRLYNAVLQFNDFYDILMSCIFLLCYLSYMLLANFLGQSYTEHSVKILESTYNTLWYVAPLPIQRLFLIMQKSIKSHKMVLGGLFVASIEGFSTVISYVLLTYIVTSVNIFSSSRYLLINIYCLYEEELSFQLITSALSYCTVMHAVHS